MTLKEEKKKAVIDLYFNQNKTYRDVCKEKRMSPRDVTTIIREAKKKRSVDTAVATDPDSGQKQGLNQLQNRRLHTKSRRCTKQTQAYSLFFKGKTPIQVAIDLNLSEAVVRQYYWQYCKLKGLNGLIQAYHETDGHLSAFLNLYNMIRSNGLHQETVVNAIKEFKELEFTGRKIERARKYFIGLDNRIRNSLRLIHDYESVYKNIQESIRQLRKERRQLERFVDQFSNNESYLKIKEIVKERLDDIIIKNTELRKTILNKSGYVERKNPAIEDFLIARIINDNDNDSNNNDSSSIANNNNNDNASIISKSEDYYKSTLQRARNSYNSLLKGATHEIIDLAMPTPTTAAPEKIQEELGVNEQDSANFNGLVHSKIPPYDGTDDLTIQYEMILANKQKTLLDEIM